MSEIRKQGHSICGYIDDFLMAENSYKKALKATLAAAKLFDFAGFVVHPIKSQLLPAQKNCFFWGF